MDFHTQPCQTSSGSEPQPFSKTSSLRKSDRKWDLHKDEIYRTYMQEDNSLLTTMERFEQRYGFKASVRKWKLKLKEWNFNKYVRTEEMMFVVAKSDERAGREGKNTAFLHEGTPIKNIKIEKFKRRKISHEKEDRYASMRTPEAITYSTPPAESVPPTYDDQLPMGAAAGSLMTDHPILMDVSNIQQDNGVHHPGQLLMTGNLASQGVLEAELYGANSPHSHHITEDSDNMSFMMGLEADIEPRCWLSEHRQSLLTLSREVMQVVLKNLSLEDVFHLGLACKKLQYLLTDDKICKLILQRSAPYSKEAMASTKNGASPASAFRRVAKRREAFKRASPFAVATIGFGDAYIYCQGILCYVIENRIRVLDLHNSGGLEFVISIPGLLREAVPAIGVEGVFQLLYCSHSVISCIFNSVTPNRGAWLIAFNVRMRSILMMVPLNSIGKIFARHNENFLYLGTNTGTSTEGNETWTIECYEFEARKWYAEKSYVLDIPGSEIGFTICFEIFGPGLIAVTSDESFEFEGADCTSFYSCVWVLPVNSRSSRRCLLSKNTKLWRRQHGEGPIDDRWSSLRLDVDEARGVLKIVESRKEWYKGSSLSEARYYITDIDPKFLGLQTGLPATFSRDVQESHTYTTDFQQPEPSPSVTIANTALPSSAILRLLALWDHPRHIPPPVRLPENVHPVRHGSYQPTFTSATSKVRCYESSASTALHLVDDPLPLGWQGRQRLRLRADSRKRGPRSLAKSDPSSDLSISLAEMFIVPDIIYWPPAQDPCPGNGDDAIDKIYRLLNPPTHLGNVKGTADERSLVYMTGPEEEPQAIIFISFDPATKLEGLKGWESGNGGTSVERQQSRIPYIDVGEGERIVAVEKPSMNDVSTSTAMVSGCVSGGITWMDIGRGKGERSKENSTPNTDWIWSETAMYRDINLGFYFAH